MKTISSFLILSLFIGIIGFADAQTTRVDSFVSLNSILKTIKIRDDNYVNINYQKDGKKFSNFSMLNRMITHVELDGKKCLKIVETQSGPGINNNNTTAIFDESTLKPIHYEVRVNDTLSQKADFDSKSMIFSDSLTTKNIKREIELSPSVFLSTSFSELIESVDFNKYPKVKFETITPGRSPRLFLVERIKEIKKGQVDCWLLKFTTFGANNLKISAGYRYIAKNTGKVLAFQSKMESDTFFAYERLQFY